ncbi:MAG TPA: type II toxin-antitoxin system VapC family toxin [Pyrinomonadaceae bacterium]|nr:type II toxin-antitoxin system VapC family toxin [Pyrinomonadaceae bacterium]
MNKKDVLDASAVLAFLYDENGADEVEPLLETSLISTVNLAEVFTQLISDGMSAEKAQKNLSDLKMTVVNFSSKHALKTAELRPLTKHLGLSLGDRSCLALAILENATAVTADKIWAKLNFCKVEVIR